MNKSPNKFIKKYIPSSRAWRISVVLFVMTHATGLILPIFIFWLSIAFCCYCAITLNLLALAAILYSLVSFIIVLFSSSIALISYLAVEIICKFLFGNSVKLLDLTSTSSIQKLDHATPKVLLIVIISSLPFFMIQLISAIYSFPDIKPLETISEYIDIENFISAVLTPNAFLKFSWIWLITAAYLYKRMFEK